MNTDKKKFSLGKLLLLLVVVLLLVFLFVNVFGLKKENPVEDRAGLSDYYNSFSTGYKGQWKLGSNVGSLNTNVAPGVKAKRTKILGNSKDVVTILVYMCGSDLESKNAMGVYDLQEMASAKLSDNINLIVYTGGSTRWHTEAISNRVNQIYRVRSGGIERLVDNAGTGAMVDPNTLLSFIEWGVENYEANRYELIMWDHGSGSVGGYGYDEKNPRLGSMTLHQLDQALTAADVNFDFIGFDACLMANTEAALMLAEHADYLIASEESEPGIGWYYTDWLNALSRNTSMPTLEIGKNIVDSFVATCEHSTRGQSATLSVIDLAEMSATVPSKLSAFASTTTGLIKGNNFKTVANARGNTREFAASQYADLVDLVDLATNVGTKEGNELAQALLSCIKYNNTSNDMYNSYGLSIYFPYRSTKYINSVLNTYNNIDMNPEYAECVRSFATYATSGQLASGGSHNAYQSYNSYNSNGYYSSQNSADLIFALIEAFANSNYNTQPSYSNYYGSVLDLLFRGGIDRSMTEYIAENHFDADLTFKDGKIALTKDQLELVDSIRLNMFVDDGTGYIDLGKDNIFEYDDSGNLLAISDKTWLAASTDQSNWQVIPYYLVTEIEEESGALISYGKVPVILNGDDAELILKLDDSGIEVVGARYLYDDVDVVAKSLTEIVEGDEIQFVCDFYDYDGNYQASHVLNDKLVVANELYIGDINLGDQKILASYEIRDIYQQSYWTTPMQ